MTHIWRARIAYSILVLATVFAFYRLQRQDAVACHDRRHQWTALHSVIVKSYATAKPSAALLNAFPQLKPFYTPGSPQYDEQQRLATGRRDDVLAVLGDRPDC